MIMLLSRFITALGNFSIQYNFQAISVSLIAMSVEQCTSTVDHCAEGKQAQWVSGTATATVFAGAILGQLSVSNRGSRKRRLYIISFLLIVPFCQFIDGISWRYCWSKHCDDINTEYSMFGCCLLCDAPNGISNIGLYYYYHLPLYIRSWTRRSISIECCKGYRR